MAFEPAANDDCVWREIVDLIDRAVRIQGDMTRGHDGRLKTNNAPAVEFAARNPLPGSARPGGHEIIQQNQGVIGPIKSRLG
jgi:hypothetical protein